MPEKESDFISNQDDLRNEDVLRRILESGTVEELERARAFHNLTPEQLKLFSDYAKLRKKTHEQMDQELKARISRSPGATEEELAMGCYQENLEPQAREAVLKLRRKGYATYESGFSGFSKQKIGFKKDYLNNFQFPEELRSASKEKGIDIKIEPNAISFTCDKYFDLAELERFWSEIENILPNLPRQPAEPCDLPAAKSFRKKHGVNQ